MKEITITIPDNCELKQDGNIYTIVEKEKKVTYNDIARELFNNGCCYIDCDGSIMDVASLSNSASDLNNCATRRQAEKLLAINKLMNVAKYLNGDWQPNWSDYEEYKYYIYYDNSNTYSKLKIDYNTFYKINSVYFKSKELAKQAIEILGEEAIKLALCTDY